MEGVNIDQSPLALYFICGMFLYQQAKHEHHAPWGTQHPQQIVGSISLAWKGCRGPTLLLLSLTLSNAWMHTSKTKKRNKFEKQLLYSSHPVCSSIDMLHATMLAPFTLTSKSKSTFPPISGSGVSVFSLS